MGRIGSRVQVSASKIFALNVVTLRGEWGYLWEIFSGVIYTGGNVSREVYLTELYFVSSEMSVRTYGIPSLSKLV